jgi:thiamine-phosphate pyrophosphorylase
VTRLRGVYAITPDAEAPPTALAQAVDHAIAGGAAVVQFRDKTPPSRARAARAGAVLAVCRARGVPLLINDDLDLAARLGADGVHLGRDDATLAQARRQLGPHAIIGVSCYDDFARALAAADQGADYLAFGSFFASSTKPGAVRAPLELLRRARAELAVPVVAIGGITPENGRALIDAGAHMLAVVSGIFAGSDVAAAALAYARLFPEDS